MSEIVVPAPITIPTTTPPSSSPASTPTAFTSSTSSTNNSNAPPTPPSITYHNAFLFFDVSNFWSGWEAYKSETGLDKIHYANFYNAFRYFGKNSQGSFAGIPTAVGSYEDGHVGPDGKPSWEKYLFADPAAERITGKWKVRKEIRVAGGKEALVDDCIIANIYDCVVDNMDRKNGVVVLITGDGNAGDGQNVSLANCVRRVLEHFPNWSVRVFSWKKKCSPNYVELAELYGSAQYNGIPRFALMYIEDIPDFAFRNKRGSDAMSSDDEGSGGVQFTSLNPRNGRSGRDYGSRRKKYNNDGTDDEAEESDSDEYPRGPQFPSPAMTGGKPKTPQDLVNSVEFLRKKESEQRQILTDIIYNTILANNNTPLGRFKPKGREIDITKFIVNRSSISELVLWINNPHLLRDEIKSAMGALASAGVTLATAK